VRETHNGRKNRGACVSHYLLSPNSLVHSCKGSRAGEDSSGCGFETFHRCGNEETGPGAREVPQETRSPQIGKFHRSVALNQAASDLLDTLSPSSDDLQKVEKEWL